MLIVPGEHEQDLFSGALDDEIAYFSGSTGRTSVLVVEGSSRSFMYRLDPAGCGTLKVESINPVGTGAVRVNCSSEATESIRNKFVPLSWHGLSTLSGQRSSFSTGTRTKVAKGCQSPLVPSACIGRNCRRPNAEGPSAFLGATTARKLSESRQIRVPSATVSSTLNDSSSVATSMRSERGNLSGISVFRRNEISPSSGNASALPRRMAGEVPPSWMLLLTSVTLGRGGCTLVGSS